MTDTVSSCTCKPELHKSLREVIEAEKTCPIHKPNQTKDTVKKWEEEFDEKFPYGVMIDYDEKTDTWEIDVTDDIKSFISKVEQSAYERGVADTKFPYLKETPRYTKLLPIKRKRNGKTINK